VRFALEKLFNKTFLQWRLIMKKLLLLLTLCALLAGIETNCAEARQGSNVQYIHHRQDSGFQFGFNGNGFFFGYDPGYGYRNYGYRNCGYRGCGYFGGWDQGLHYRFRNEGYRNYRYPYAYAPDYYYYNPRAYDYYGPQHYNHPYRGGRYWRY
jgi:hypothetical protein